MVSEIRTLRNFFTKTKTTFFCPPPPPCCPFSPPPPFEFNFVFLSPPVIEFFFVEGLIPFPIKKFLLEKIPDIFPPPYFFFYFFVKSHPPFSLNPVCSPGEPTVENLSSMHFHCHALLAEDNLFFEIFGTERFPRILAPSTFSPNLTPILLALVDPLLSSSYFFFTQRFFQLTLWSADIMAFQPPLVRNFPMLENNVPVNFLHSPPLPSHLLFRVL